MLLAEFVRETVASLVPLYGREEAGSIVSMLCGERLGVKSYTHIIEPGTVVDASLLPGLREDVSRLVEGEPVQYVLGFAEFCGRRFRVCPDVLVPRPETGQLVQMASEFISGREMTVLDLCTGSGCIAWSVALDNPGTSVTGVDISPSALSVASSQPFTGNVPAFVEEDILHPSSDFSPCDLILSNPPYVRDSEKRFMRKNVLDFEPAIALFVPDSDPLVFYRAVAGWAERLLLPGGMGIVEINEELSAETAEVFLASGFQGVEAIRDFYGRFRFVRFRKNLL